MTRDEQRWEKFKALIDQLETTAPRKQWVFNLVNSEAFDFMEARLKIEIETQQGLNSDAQLMQNG